MATLSDNRLPDALFANHDKFLAFLIPRVGSTMMAEDILQSAYVKGMERAAQLRAEDSAIAWFYRILRNAVVDHYRRDASQKRATEEFDREFSATLTPGSEAERTICQCVGGLVEDLKPEYAKAITKVDLEGESVEDFAREEGITTNNASVRLHRARKALGKELVKTCGLCAEHKCINCTCH